MTASTSSDQQHQAAGAWITLDAGDGRRLRAYLSLPRAGLGPGLLVLHGAGGIHAGILALCRRFADEGYAVIAPEMSRHLAGGGPAARDAALGDIRAARAALAPHLEAGARTGAIAIAEGGALAWRLAAEAAIDALVCHGLPFPIGRESVPALLCPAALHLAGAAAASPALATLASTTTTRQILRVHDYPECQPDFFDPLHAAFEPHAAAVAHSRTLGILRPALGPHYDLARLFQEHLRQEFVAHDADATMETMVGTPYVNHVPTLTGGVGHDTLKRFYKYHFIPNLPQPRHSVLLSETVGPDTVILELVTIFTHNVEIDYLLPGIPPTGKQVEIPTVVIAKFRGDKLYHEHIYWDQACVLAQLGLIDPTGLPVAGVAAARKMLDQSRPANELMPRWKESAGKPI